MLVVPDQRVSLRRVSWVVRGCYSAPMQRIIVLPVLELLSDSPTDLEPELWGDRHVAGIEQAVNVAAQKNAVGQSVLATVGVGPNMGRI
jgi:hypothetical protein